MRVLAAVFVALTAASATALTPPCPCILGVSPTFAKPAGGDVITLTGINLHAPARIFVDYDSRSIEAVVLNVTNSRLQFLAPTVDMGDRQILTTSIRGVFDSGTPREFRAAALLPLVYENISLTPVIIAVSPQSGPLMGATRITIFGEGFQAPVQVFVGDQEAQVITVTFSQIVVFAPPGVHAGPADVRVVNINSGTSVIARNAFRYTEPMRITSISPTTGPAIGSTPVHIFGSGFDVPIAITIAGQIALPIRVTSTEIVAVTTPIGVVTA
ncbi:MAG TPA: IPT/TIG domain-containing protein, partial [Thermoanaerobaculia bacterium]|nr:IPT/TIG domain-containing protein [Thermoanaerobaculia bacterium]